MRWIMSQIARLGDYLMSLSDRARMQLIIIALLMLGGGGVYKLVRSVQRLSEPLPAASAQELIRPMQRLFSDTKGNLNSYQQTRRQELSRLDSLATIRTKQTETP